MCGIFGVISKRLDASQIVLKGLKTLEYRGYDSWGIAVLANDRKNKLSLTIKKKAGKIGSATIDDLPKSDCALGHTRWATHGGVTDKNAHPHLDCSGNFAIIHNGIIENYDEIKKELHASNHTFISETDTEVAVHLIEEIFNSFNKKKTFKTDEENFIESVRLAFNRFVGSNAIIVVSSKCKMFVAAKNGSPLVVGLGKNENFLSSDAHALLPYTHDVYFMEDGSLVAVKQDSIKQWNLDTGKNIPLTPTHLSWKETVADKGRYSHFMMKEIMDQPDIIRRIATEENRLVSQFAGEIKKSYGTYLVGCGTAAYACLAATYIFSKVARRHVNFAVGSEFSYSLDFLTPKSFVIALSQSGETLDVLDAAKKAKEKHVRLGSIVNVLGSTLHRMSDVSLLLGAGTETAVVSTKAFSAKLAYITLLAYVLAGKEKEGKSILKKAASSLEKVLMEPTIGKVVALADKIKNKEHLYVIGRGISYPLALETALKIKEASYIHAEGFAAGELKHGVIALIEKGTPCIAFLPNDETYGANLAGAMEMKARGGYIIGISHKSHEIFDYYIPVDDCGVATIIAEVAVGQLLGYYLALKRGNDPDKPRNLAKSVTVK